MLLGLNIIKGGYKMITRQKLHKVEMELVNLCEDNEVMKEAIINSFTDLMSDTE